MSFYAFVVVCVIGGACPSFLTDQRGPYITKQECFERGSMMIRDMSNVALVVYSQAYCTTEDPDKMIDSKDEVEA